MNIDFGSATIMFALLVVCICFLYLWRRAESKHRKLKQSLQ